MIARHTFPEFWHEHGTWALVRESEAALRMLADNFERVLQLVAVRTERGGNCVVRGKDIASDKRTHMHTHTYMHVCIRTVNVHLFGELFRDVLTQTRSLPQYMYIV